MTKIDGNTKNPLTAGFICGKVRDYAEHVYHATRLLHPLVRVSGAPKGEARFRQASWDEALAAVAERLKSSRPERIAAIAGDLAGAEEMFALKALMTSLGVASLDARQDGARLDPAFGRASYLFNPGIEGIEQADAILIVGSNPRLEAAVLNARIRKRWRQGGVKIGVIGPRADLTYAHEHLGAGPQTLKEVADGKQSSAGILRAAKRPMVIVGSGAAARADGQAVLSAAARVALQAGHGKDAGWTVFNVLHTAASRVAGLDLGKLLLENGDHAVGELARAREIAAPLRLVELGAPLVELLLDLLRLAELVLLLLPALGHRLGALVEVGNVLLDAREAIL